MTVHPIRRLEAFLAAMTLGFGAWLNASGQIELFRAGANGNLGIRLNDTDFANTTTVRVSGSYVAD